MASIDNRSNYIVTVRNRDDLDLLPVVSTKSM